ncbi:DUF3152 domain-containing protein [Aeromicrobium sp. CTD01-1L150]|uniref:DUF3152 domain-containing protein n=1 Tax=Aeromicrobium sp. CTD01-1L150 TaxID=3341830 RepID=UPI0035BF2162
MGLAVGIAAGAVVLGVLVWPPKEAPTAPSGGIAAPTRAVVPDDTRPRPTGPSRAPTRTPAPVPQEGAGTFSVASGDDERRGAEGRLVEYRVEVEDGLGIEAEDFADAVGSTLAHPRGWTADGRFSFRHTADARLRVVLASPATTDRLCAPLQTRGEVSCRNGDDVVINARRWTEGAAAYDRLGDYRHYVVNHEVGHALGFGHEPCSAPGEPAPVMLQQTLGLQGCEPNPWP